MHGKPLTVAAVQMRFRPTVGENLAFIVEQVQSCGRAGVDAVAKLLPPPFGGTT